MYSVNYLKMLIFEIYPSILIKKGKKSVERQNLTEQYLYYNKSGIKLLSAFEV